MVSLQNTVTRYLSNNVNSVNECSVKNGRGAFATVCHTFEIRNLIATFKSIFPLNRNWCFYLFLTFLIYIKNGI